jgi:hypothetical protein
MWCAVSLSCFAIADLLLIVCDHASGHSHCCACSLESDGKVREIEERECARASHVLTQTQGAWTWWRWGGGGRGVGACAQCLCVQCLCVRVPVCAGACACAPPLLSLSGHSWLRELRVALLSASSVFELQAPHQTALGHDARVCAVSDVAPGRLAPARMRAKSQDCARGFHVACEGVTEARRPRIGPGKGTTRTTTQA